MPGPMGVYGIDEDRMAAAAGMAALGLLVLPQVLPIVVGLAMPGRKGKMLTRAEEKRRG